MNAFSFGQIAFLTVLQGKALTGMGRISKGSVLYLKLNVSGSAILVMIDYRGLENAFVNFYFSCWVWEGHCGDAHFGALLWTGSWVCVVQF